MEVDIKSLSYFLEFLALSLMFDAEEYKGPPTYAENKQLFLPYRGFCGRKGVTSYNCCVSFSLVNAMSAECCVKLTCNALVK